MPGTQGIIWVHLIHMKSAISIAKTALTCGEYDHLPLKSIASIMGLKVLTMRRAARELGMSTNRQYARSTGQNHSKAGLCNIYFIREVPDGPIKIGVAGCVSSRFHALQCSNPRKLAVIGVIWDCSPELESEIHQLFSESRIRGEWFDASSDILKYVAENSDRY